MPHQMFYLVPCGRDTLFEVHVSTGDTLEYTGLTLQLNDKKQWEALFSDLSFHNYYHGVVGCSFDSLSSALLEIKKCSTRYRYHAV